MPDPIKWNPRRPARTLALLVLSLLASGALAQPTPPDAADPTPTPATTEQELAPEPATEPEPPAIRARVWEDLPETRARLGAEGDDSPYMLSIEFSPFGAGIERLSLPHTYKTVSRDEHVVLQRTRVGAGGVSAVPFAAVKVRVGDRDVPLSAAGVWKQDPADPGRFTAEIIEDGDPILRITRRFVLREDAHDLELRQTIQNLTDRALTVAWTQTGPIDLDPPASTYGGDKRRIRYGYLLNPEAQGGSGFVTADSKLHERTKLLGKFGPGGYELSDTVWPNTWSEERGFRLSWIAMTDRYFAVVAHPLLGADAASATGEQKLFGSAGSVTRLVLNRTTKGNESGAPAIPVLQFNGPEFEIQPGATADVSIGVYAGPLDDRDMSATPTLEALGLERLVVYNFGSICAMCTFSWLTHLLLAILRAMHVVTSDWGLSIILLVFVVRAILHPITRWSQIRMQIFGSQMQGIAPKQQKLKEKYADDPKKLQQETGKLWKEEGISPAGMLGCLPMFLQSPVWIALYATLFFVHDLRHEPAFYGVFQQIGGWPFLADLASPDSAIPLPDSWHFSFWIWGTVSAINVLPLLLGVVFFAHQKYLTPPTATTMTPEQEQTQKVMKVMMVVMFPIFMYAAPSGLSLYFITNSTIAIFENRWIRAHIKKHDMLNVDKIKAKRASKGKSGFLARLMEIAEKRQQERLRETPGAGRAIKAQQNKPPKKKVENKSYKKRR